MLEYVGDIWDKYFDSFIRCILTNGLVKSDCSAIMGAGIAKQAAERYSSLPRELGMLLHANGNNCYYFPRFNLITFPTKYHYKDYSSLDLIIKSCLQLNELIEKYHIEKCVLPRPGCGYGKLNWRNDVQPAIRNILSNKVLIISKTIN